MTSTIERPKAKTTRTTIKAELILTINGRSFELILWAWTDNDCPVYRLRDRETNEIYSVVHLSNLPYSKQGDCSCSCSPDVVLSRCDHVRAIQAVNLI